MCGRAFFPFIGHSVCEAGGFDGRGRGACSARACGQLQCRSACVAAPRLLPLRAAPRRSSARSRGAPSAPSTTFSVAPTTWEAARERRGGLDQLPDRRRSGAAPSTPPTSCTCSRPAPTCCGMCSHSSSLAVMSRRGAAAAAAAEWPGSPCTDFISRSPAAWRSRPVAPPRGPCLSRQVVSGGGNEACGKEASRARARRRRRKSQAESATGGAAHLRAGLRGAGHGRSSSVAPARHGGRGGRVGRGSEQRVSET